MPQPPTPAPSPRRHGYSASAVPPPSPPPSLTQGQQPTATTVSAIEPAATSPPDEAKSTTDVGIQQLFEAAFELREVEAELSSKLMTIALRLEETLGSGELSLFLEPAQMIIETSEEVRNLEKLLLQKDLEIGQLRQDVQDLLAQQENLASGTGQQVDEI